MAKTRERIIPDNFKTKEEYLIFLRHLFEYKSAKEKLSTDDFILEIGCGEGYGTSLLSEGVEKIIGMDIDKDIIDNASGKYGSENCIFQQFNGVNIPYNDNTFDVVVSFHVIEHVQNDLSFISEIYRVLKKEGMLIVATPNKTYRVGKSGKFINEFHLREYYSNELKQALRSRFSDIKIMGVFGNKEVQRTEIERLKLITGIISYDPLNISRIVPLPVKTIIFKLLKSAIYKSKKEEDNNYLNKFSTKDYYLTENNIESSLDLLAICKK